MAVVVQRIGRTLLGVGLIGTYLMAMATLTYRSYRPISYEFNDVGLFTVLSLAAIGLTLLVRERQLARWWYGLPVAAAGLAIVSWPSTSADPFRYLFDGELLRVWHLSPYTHVPANFPLDQYSRVFAGVWWSHIPSPYGPLWQGLMAVVNWVSANHLVAGLIALKAIGLAGWLVSARYLYLLTRKAWVALAWLVNPVIVLDALQTPHADVMIAALVLAACYHSRATSRGLAVGAAALIKPHVVVVAPFLARGRELGRLVGTMMGLVVVGLGLTLVMTGVSPWAVVQASLGGAADGGGSLLLPQLVPGLSATASAMGAVLLGGLYYGAIVAAYWSGRLAARPAMAAASLAVPLFLTGLVYPWHFMISMALLLAADATWGLEVVLLITLLAFRAPMSILAFFGFALAGAIVRWCLHHVSDPPKAISWI